jgi:hypothetical protein
MLSIVLSISLHSAYGQDVPFITVNTDETNYSEGDTIYVSGDVNEVLFGHEVSLMVIAPNGNVISIDKLNVDSNKKFQTELTTSNTLMETSGIFTVVAMYGPENGSTKTTFTFKQLTGLTYHDESKQNILLNFDFVNPNQSIQEHIDYKITVFKNGVDVFGPTRLTHSATGSISIPIMITEGQPHDVVIEVYEIMFQPIPVETMSFSIMTGSENIQSQFTSKNTLKINLAIDRDPSSDPKVIPEWIKNNAGWWAEGQIDDDSFVQGIQYLIKEKIVNIPKLPYPSSRMDDSVPSWVKNNASWWADDLIPEDDFIKGIKYLVEKGVVQI